MTTPPFATKPTLVGQRITLRPFLDEDLLGIMKAVSDPEVGYFTGSHHVPTDERLRQWYTSRNDQVDRLDLAIVDHLSGACVGEVVLNEWNAGNDSCNFRILVGPTGRGRGLGTEATRLMLGHAFGVLGLRQVSLEVYAFNRRARHVYETVGFRVATTASGVRMVDGRGTAVVTMTYEAPTHGAGPTAGNSTSTAPGSPCPAAGRR